MAIFLLIHNHVTIMSFDVLKGFFYALSQIFLVLVIVVFQIWETLHSTVQIRCLVSLLAKAGRRKVLFFCFDV